MLAAIWVILQWRQNFFVVRRVTDQRGAAACDGPFPGPHFRAGG